MCRNVGTSGKRAEVRRMSSTEFEARLAPPLMARSRMWGCVTALWLVPPHLTLGCETALWLVPPRGALHARSRTHTARAATLVIMAWCVPQSPTKLGYAHFSHSTPIPHLRSRATFVRMLDNRYLRSVYRVT